MVALWSREPTPTLRSTTAAVTTLDFPRTLAGNVFGLVLIVSRTLVGAVQASTSRPMSPFAAREVSLERWEGNNVFGAARGAFGGNDVPE